MRIRTGYPSTAEQSHVVFLLMLCSAIAANMSVWKILILSRKKRKKRL